MAVANQDAIWKVANELDSEGIKPTLSAIRKRLGAGSFTTISDAMAEWRKKKEDEARPVSEPLPTELAQLAQNLAIEIWRAARLAADQAFVGEREALAAELSAAHEQAREAVELADQLALELEKAREEISDAAQIKIERDQLQSKLDKSEESSAAAMLLLEEKLSQRESEASEARMSERSALDRASRADGQIEALQGQLANLTAALASTKSGASLKGI